MVVLRQPANRPKQRPLLAPAPSSSFLTIKFCGRVNRKLLQDVIISSWRRAKNRVVHDSQLRCSNPVLTQVTARGEEDQISATSNPVATVSRSVDEVPGKPSRIHKYLGASATNPSLASSAATDTRLNGMRRRVHFQLPPEHYGGEFLPSSLLGKLLWIHRLSPDLR